MIAPSRSACSAARASRSARSIEPLASTLTTTTHIPAITALAGLVPCAEDGIRHTSRWPSPRSSWYARITSNPAYSPWAPELGWSETAGNPLISASHPDSSRVTAA